MIDTISTRNAQDWHEVRNALEAHYSDIVYTHTPLNGYPLRFRVELEETDENNYLKILIKAAVMDFSSLFLSLYKKAETDEKAYSTIYSLLIDC